MQKARRFLYSTTPLSSSNTTIRTRKRSRTPSPESDSLVASKEKPGNDDSGSGSEFKACHSKCRKCSRPNNPRKLQKPRVARKPLKSGVRSLQNAVVLAPFNTLKKCFQTKLIDLYSLERMKKINHKVKMAKRQNVSFEYDIIEMKSSDFVKKEAKGGSKTKQKPRCKKTGENAQKKPVGNTAKPKKKARSKEFLTPEAPPHLPGTFHPKRRKPGCVVVTPTILKTEIGPRQSFFVTNQSLVSDPCLSSSVVSSQSKADSWDSYSNSPSYKEDYTEGLLTMSTTSFDCYLESFDQGDWNFRKTRKKCNKPGENLLSTPEQATAELTEKDHEGSSRHLIRHVERNPSDGEIVDFIDREPQAQEISSKESNHHLQPLRRQIRAKSKNSDRDSMPVSSPLPVSFSPTRTSQEASEISDHTASKSKLLQIEVATQVEGNIFEKGSSPGCLVTTEPEAPASDFYCEGETREKSWEEPVCGPDSPLPSQKPESPPHESFSDSESSCKIVDFPETNPLRVQPNDKPTQAEEKGDSGAESEACEKNFFGGPLTPTQP